MFTIEIRVFGRINPGIYSLITSLAYSVPANSGEEWQSLQDDIVLILALHFHSYSLELEGCILYKRIKSRPS